MRRVSASSRHSNLNVQVSNKRASKSMKQKQIKLKGEICKFTVMAGEVNTAVSARGRTERQKVNMDIIITESTVPGCMLNTCIFSFGQHSSL